MHSMQTDSVGVRCQVLACGWRMPRDQGRKHLSWLRRSCWNKPTDSVSHMQATLTNVNQNRFESDEGQKVA